MRPVIAEVRRPEICSDAEIAAFCCFVRQGGEVDAAGLEGRVRRANALTFLYVDHTLVAVGALKQPSQVYRDGVFEAAGVPKDATSFGLELGWVFVPPEHRRRHYSRVVSAAAVTQADGAPVFATTRLDNKPMQKTLEHLNFKKAGNNWASKRGSHKLVLYVTSANKRMQRTRPTEPERS